MLPLKCKHFDFSKNGKLSEIEVNNSIYKYDMICISETYVDSYISSEDKRIQLDWCNLIREDNPSNTKRGGVCIYYKESLRI